jgi:large subunit ribosomal protein L4
MANKVENIAIDVLSQDGKKLSSLPLNGEVFSIAPHTQTMFDAVINARANARQSNAKSKTKSEVAGSGIKPWKQKGTGRARAGMKRSPIWVGGGVTFGPTGRENYVRSQNKKQYRLALRSALSDKFLTKNLIVIDSLALTSGKTKDALSFLQTLKLETKKVLIVVEQTDEKLLLAVRNLTRIYAVSRSQLSAIDVIDADVVILTKPVISQLEEALQ